MAFEGEEGVVADHAVAVVGDADELAAASFDLDANAGGVGVEGVFSSSDDRGRAFDDFANGDLIGDEIGEEADAAHRSIVRRPMDSGGMATGSDIRLQLIRLQDAERGKRRRIAT